MLLCRFVDLILLATFVAGGDTDASLWSNLQVNVIGLVDVFGMALAMRQVRGQRSVAFGWSVADTVMRRLLPLWIGARALEWTTDHIQSAVESNIALAATMTLGALLWSTKKESVP